MTVYIVTCCWSTKPCSVMVSAVFATEADALTFVAEQEAMAANKGASFVVWGRDVR